MRALISGVAGQDGSYLAELLLSKGYEVHGITRHTAVETHDMRYSRLRRSIKRITLHHADTTSYPAMEDIILKVEPDELYHLAAMSFVGNSFQDQHTCMESNLSSTHYLLEITKKFNPKCKFYFAGTSEMYGNSGFAVQDEETPFKPCSPYGISKYAAYNLCQMYRKYGLKIYCGILFNHTSERRGEIFASRKITKAVAEIALGRRKTLELGNISAQRDFGYAPEYVNAMYLMLKSKPDNYVIATNETHSIEEIVDIAFDYAHLEKKKHLRINKALLRPSELHSLQGNYAKANMVFGWKPKLRFKDIIKKMVDYDIRNCS